MYLVEKKKKITILLKKVHTSEEGTTYHALFFSLELALSKNTVLKRSSATLSLTVCRVHTQHTHSAPQKPKITGDNTMSTR